MEAQFPGPHAKFDSNIIIIQSQYSYRRVWFGAVAGFHDRGVAASVLFYSFFGKKNSTEEEEEHQTRFALRQVKATLFLLITI